MADSASDIVCTKTNNDENDNQQLKLNYV